MRRSAAAAWRRAFGNLLKTPFSELHEPNRSIIVMDDAQSLYVHAAEEIAHFAGEAICMHGEFMLCLSGGSTPAATYDLLADALPL